jgi:hypothetical protein
VTTGEIESIHWVLTTTEPSGVVLTRRARWAALPRPDARAVDIGTQVPLGVMGSGSMIVG